MGKSFVQVDPQSSHCPQPLSFTATCLRCVTNRHSQVKMQSWNDSALMRMIRRFIWRMTFVWNIVSLIKQPADFWCQLNKFQRDTMTVISLPVCLLFVNLLSHIQVHTRFKCHQHSLHVVSSRTLLIICPSWSNVLTDGFKPTFTAVHFIRKTVILRVLCKSWISLACLLS